MIDRETVIRALENCTKGSCPEDCPYIDVDCYENIARDALELLRGKDDGKEYED